MKCEEIKELLTQYLLGDLDVKMTATVKTHIDECGSCRAFAHEDEQTLDLLRDALAATPLPELKLSATAKDEIFSEPEAASKNVIKGWLFERHRWLVPAAAALLVCGFVLFGIQSMVVPRMSKAVLGMDSGSMVFQDCEVAEEEYADADPFAEVGALAEVSEPVEIDFDNADFAANAPMATPKPSSKKMDTVAAIKSPVKMHGVFGGRSAGTRGASLQAYGGGKNRNASFADGDDIDIEISIAEEVAKMELPAVMPMKEEKVVGKNNREYRRNRQLDQKQQKKVVAHKKAKRRVDSFSDAEDDGIAFGYATADKLGRDMREEGAVTACYVFGSKLAKTKSKSNVAIQKGPSALRGSVGDVARPSALREYDGDVVLAKEEKAEKELEDRSYEMALAKKVAFKPAAVNQFIAVSDKPFSTFAIDVDTASYTLARNYLNRGQRPPVELVRTEEFVNFFDYDYRAPERDLFRVDVEVAPSKFGHGLQMMKIGVKGKRLGREEQRQAVLTFLVDTSGSMNKADRIGLIKKSLSMLMRKLSPNDLVAIVQYGSDARLLLEHTPASEQKKILNTIKAMQCNGSTNLERGMKRAYQVAASSFVGGGENRVLLLSDGVATLGADSAEDILKDVEKYKKQGITCSVFGFGMATYDDAMLEKLANRGDGSYMFIDSEDEARRVFVDDLAATLNTIATDVKIQVEFKQKQVVRYRQLGYENRQLKKEDFRNNAIDAGEVGSGQSVTALYELDMNQSFVMPQSSRGCKRAPAVVAVVRVRYRRVDTGEVEEIEYFVTERDMIGSFDQAPARFRLAACVAETAEILRGSSFANGSELKDVAKALRPVALELSLDKRVQELLRIVNN